MRSLPVPIRVHLRHPAQLLARHDAQLERLTGRLSSVPDPDKAKTEGLRRARLPPHLGHVTFWRAERTSCSKPASHC
jgi:hypothetical protein